MEQPRVFIRDQGEGAAVLLLHGDPTGSYDWHKIWPMLVHGHRLIAPDSLGLGFSDKPRGLSNSISSHAQTIEALMDSLGIGEVHVVAHDLGVRVAQEMLALRELPGTNSLIRGFAEFCVNGQSTAGQSLLVRKHNGNQEARSAARTAGQPAGRPQDA